MADTPKPEHYEGMPQLDLAFWPNLIFWLVVTMVVLYFLLARIALPRIAGIMRDRHQTVANDLEAAAELKRKAEEAEAAYDKALAEARSEAQKIAASKAPAADPRDGAVALIRDAARLDLPPPRLADLRTGTVVVETARTDAARIYRHPDRARVDLQVVGQLSRAGLFVTTLEAVNRSPDPVEIDVRRLRAREAPRSGTGGGFLAIGWTRSTLAPAGAPGFTVRLYVVSREPFDRVTEAAR